MDSKQKGAPDKNRFAPMLAGISGGSVSTALLLPLDNIKVRLQVHEGDNGASTSGRKHGHRFGALRILRGVIKHEGFSGLYQGFTPALVGSAVSWGGFFFVYESFKQQLRLRKASSSKDDGTTTLNSVDNFTLACASGAVMVCITNPVWLIKLRMQLQMKKASQHLHTGIQPYNNMVDAARTIVREEGFWALYKGAAPALLLTSHGGVQFVVYEFLRKHFHYSRAQRENDGDASSVMQRLERSLGYLSMGAIAKM
jgi:solute carrier family 25 folate transporter 32